jgi:predicted ABC-type ATPase
MMFLSLPSPELAIARVADRVRRGGHHVADDVVRRRYSAGLRNLFHVYPLVLDAWQVYDNANFAAPRLIAFGVAGSPSQITDEKAWDTLRKYDEPAS